MQLDPVIASQLVETVDTRFKQLAKMQPRTAYGTVATVDTATRKASVYVSGDPAPSIGFTFPAHILPSVGNRVRVVIDPRGDRYIEEVLPTALNSSNPTYIQINETDADDPPSVYPFGISMFYTSNGTTLGYPAGFGTVATYKTSALTTRMYQTFTGTTGAQWLRAAHTSAPDGVWNAWQRLDRKARYQPLASETTVYSSATQAGGGVAVDKSVELTNIPANLEGVVMASGRMLVRHSALSGTGQYANTRNWSTGALTTIVYALSTSQWTAAMWIAELGSTNNRKLNFEVHPGSSGTLTYHLTYGTYWTET